jgi:hypothetical protein
MLITWRRNGAYAQRLVGDLSEADMTAQPPGAVGLMNHPAWILSHLALYHGLCAQMLRGETPLDPVDHPYGPKSVICPDPAAYLPRAALVAEFARVHDEAEQALCGASEAVLARSTPLERWRAMHPTIGDMAVTLMVKHESHHLGQLSAWRRAMGRPGVPM